MTERWFIGRDYSGHRYLVPLARAAEWDAWTEIPETDERSWEEPEYAKRLDGGRLSFCDPKVG